MQLFSALAKLYTTMLRLNNLTASVADKTILKKISFNFEKGKIYAVMGPNGSGKSTLASVIAGHPAYAIRHGTIYFNKENITDLEPEKRVQKGIFMTFQSPPSLSGVTIYQLMRYSMQGKKDPVVIRSEVKKYAEKLKVPEILLNRSLNEGFSGGERKKMEVLQAVILDPTLIIFDEIDTGVDIDALKTIAKFIKLMHNKNKTFILITHYNRLLKYLKPDVVLILKDGTIEKTGNMTLANHIEKHGYGS